MNRILDVIHPQRQLHCTYTVINIFTITIIGSEQSVALPHSRIITENLACRTITILADGSNSLYDEEMRELNYLLRNL